MNSSLDLLESAMVVTEQVIVGVEPDQSHLPTPCPDYDVQTLLDHLVGFITRFADQANGVSPAADAHQVKAGIDPQAAYRQAADRLVAGYRSGPGSDAPPVGLLLMEYITHGWDLARATGQQVQYPDAAVEAALATGEGMLAPEFRGPGKAFGHQVEVAPSASPLEQLLGFMGRDPAWQPAVEWTAPMVERPEPGLSAGEREGLEQWLDYHRATLLMKCSGLNAEQLKILAIPPSALSLLGLVRHMAEVERWWFRIYVDGQQLDQEYSSDTDQTADFDDLEQADARADLLTYQAELELARTAVAAKELDHLVPAEGREPVRSRSVRWVYVHMIEEYARHNGHADLIRERIDGLTGD